MEHDASSPEVIYSDYGKYLQPYFTFLFSLFFDEAFYLLESRFHLYNINYCNNTKVALNDTKFDAVGLN